MNQQEEASLPEDFVRYRPLVEKRILEVAVDPESLKAEREKRAALRAHVAEEIPALFSEMGTEQEDGCAEFLEEEPHFLFGSLSALRPDEERRVTSRYPHGEFRNGGFVLEKVGTSDVDALLGDCFDLFVVEILGTFYCWMHFGYTSALLKRILAYRLEDDRDVVIGADHEGKKGMRVRFRFYVNEGTEDRYGDEVPAALVDLFLLAKQEIFNGCEDMLKIFHNVYGEGRYEGLKSKAYKMLQQILEKPH
ncbi:MAG: hypothetical protein V1800_03820 [Candidatus Latescibacterota bacterium]